MLFDRPIKISTANSRWAKFWKTETLLWSELCERLKTPIRGAETFEEYLRLPKAKQDELKDVGGFVAGELRDGRRKSAYVLGRDVLTLDLDNIPADGTDEILRRIEGLGCAYCVYSTRKHEPAKPRLRVLLPLARTVTADEYEPIARKAAELIGIEFCDPSTFEAARLMYWPSCCADSEYVYKVGDKPFLDPDGVLGLYADWRDVSQWPVVPGTEQQRVKQATAKQADPTAKQGIVGAFCRVYNIYDVLDKFLPGKYVPVDGYNDRYTYTGGSTTGGAIVYENGLFLYSHHATDPASGKLCNAFDLVRIHLFGDRDYGAKPDTPTNRLPSFVAMCELAASDPEVSSLLAAERYRHAVEAFGAEVPAEDSAVTEWFSKLELSPRTGQPTNTTDNIIIILENDPLLAGKLAYDEFANRGLVLGALPWDKRDERREWTDVDDAGLRHYLEKVYEITGEKRIYDAITLVAHRHIVNEVKDYLLSLTWDGKPRLDTLFIDYLGAEDNVYTRAVARKSLTAAVARVMMPGVKYDYMPILVGPQGIGKSTLLRTLGKRWFSDSLQVFEGREASEMLQGVWINEIGELAGFSKAEVSAIKQFLSRSEDIYREPYGRRTCVYPRRCVFFGTTNDSEFLRDRTGNRRFWPVDVWRQKPTKDIFRDLPGEVDQIWAEALMRWRIGEPLYLSGEAAEIALQEQESHKESNTKEGLIREFLERPIPLDWDKRTISERRMYWLDGFARESGETTKRTRVCALEIWVECFGGDPRNIKQADSREINSILESLPGWTRSTNGIRFGPYGFQRGFIRQ
ncbi:MAG TPA: virulence-associated protein E [Clostridiales bacterium]|nr:virulence-associated protein E [Clostridiales bacterium]